jgi:hypothetical protein
MNLSLASYSEIFDFLGFANLQSQKDLRAEMNH